MSVLTKNKRQALANDIVTQLPKDIVCPKCGAEWESITRDYSIIWGCGSRLFFKNKFTFRRSYKCEIDVRCKRYEEMRLKANQDKTRVYSNNE